MGAEKSKKEARMKRRQRIRKKISGTPKRPRLAVFRSLKNIYAQIVDDVAGHTLACASSLENLDDQPKFDSKVDAAKFVGKLVARRAIEKGITTVVFDRGGFLYHGRVKAVSDGAREVGLVF
jgi:large subunit ribosomal protein L18